MLDKQKLIEFLQLIGTTYPERYVFTKEEKDKNQAYGHYASAKGLCSYHDSGFHYGALATINAKGIDWVRKELGLEPLVGSN